MHYIHVLLLSIYATGCTQYTQVRIALYKKHSWSSRYQPCRDAMHEKHKAAILRAEMAELLPAMQTAPLAVAMQ